MKILVLLALFPGYLVAGSLTNQIQGVGPNGAIKPWVCIQNSAGQVTLKLAPGQSGNATRASGSANYAGGALRFHGCDYSDAYLGYIEFSSTGSGNLNLKKYTPPANVHIQLANPTVDAQGHVEGHMTYTPIAVNLDLIPPQANQYWEFSGINLSGLEFGKAIDPVVIPNLSQEDSTSSYSDLNETQTFINAGINTVRVPISWGYIQLEGPGQGELNLDYYNSYIKPLLQSLTHAKVHTIIDLHAYMRYSKFGEQYSGCGPSGQCPDGELIVDEKVYLSVWTQLVELIQNDAEIDKDYILLDLMNEPVAVPDDKVFTIQAALIKTLRLQGFNGYILIEGNSWSGLHSWTTFEWRGSDGKTYKNSELFSRENFAKVGITDLSKILINVHQYLDSDYSGTHDDCLQDLSTEGVDGFNLAVFTEYLKKNEMRAIVTEFGTGKNAKSCTQPLTEFMEYLQHNSSQGKTYGFTGWTIWSTGHGWGGYNLRVTPNSYHMQVLRNFL